MRKILISAYGCEPLKGSESGVGWHWVLQMAKHNELYVITRANNQEAIEAHLPQEIQHNVTFYYYDTATFIKRLKNKAKGLYFYYFFWQIGIIPLVWHIIKTHKVHYTMHLTFGSIWMPTFLPYFKPDFIWGPIGGGDCEPKSFLKVLSPKQRLIQTSRYWLNALSFLNPFIILPAVKAKLILSRTANTAQVIPTWCRTKVTIVSETAMEEEIFAMQRKNRPNDNTIRLITTGRLLPNKNIATAIKALAHIPSHYKITLTIIGSGSQQKQLHTLAQQIGRSDDIIFISEMPRQEVLKQIELSDIFLFPSLREGGSWSLMEAMAIGLPTICLDWAGMAVTVDNTCAIKLPVTSPEQMPHDMAKAIIQLIETPILRKQMGDAGRQRIKDLFRWDYKGEVMQKLLTKIEEERHQ